MRELKQKNIPCWSRLAERMASRPVLVTFNGKSFDWPLLETRYRMTRTIKPSAPHTHLDFLHPARNLWRIRLGSVRLAELEKHVLGWNRGADLISEMIHAVLSTSITCAAAHRSRSVQVFLHNQMDLRGLAGLASRIACDPQPSRSNPRSDRWSRAFWRFANLRSARRNGARQKTPIAHSIARALPPETDRAARWSLSRLAKRARDLALRHASYGKGCSAIRARASKLMSNWRYITNTVQKSRIVPLRSPARLSSENFQPARGSAPWQPAVTTSPETRPASSADYKRLERLERLHLQT